MTKTLCALSILLWSHVSALHLPLSTWGNSSTKYCFPNHFLFGVSTAAYQIEGAWNESGKGESIWDHFLHDHPKRVRDHSNGDIADDSYHLFKEDIRMLKELGVNFYRFSVSWPRILPTGFSNKVNKEGIKYYNELINGLIENNIAPVVTMYHWDLPQPIQDLGGWTNPAIAEYFEDYAKLLFESFGDRVKTWLTFNEPNIFCVGNGPGGTQAGIGDYMCGHNVLRAHGLTYRLYEKKFKEDQRGLLGLSLAINWYEPNTTSVRDKEAAEITRQFWYGWYLNPIFSKEGDYPPAMRERVNENSRIQNFPRSRLPYFTQEEINNIKGSFDFLGLNHYTTFMVTHKKKHINPTPSFFNDVGTALSQNKNWPSSASGWLKVVPWGFKKILNYIRINYGNPPVLVTENGFSTHQGLQDQKRINYIESYLKALHGAMKAGCNVAGYSYWSLLDNFEWLKGYTERFGLYEVDYKSPNRTRSPRSSTAYYAKIVKTKCLPASATPGYVMFNLIK